MKRVIEIPDKIYDGIKKRFPNDLCYLDVCAMANAIMNGTILPNGAEILTAEAYSDLCLRASKEQKFGKWKKDIDFGGHTHYYCSLCNSEGWHTDKFCSECGSKMEGAEE